MPAALHVYIDGLVQGVGFRYAARSQANAHQLSGWVRNLPDGRVEAWFQGKKTALELILHWCKNGPPLARVDHVDATWDDVIEPAQDSFRITF